MKELASLSVLAAWLLAVALVIQLLSGTFAVRDCQTACVQSVYYASLGFCLFALVCGWGFVKKPKPRFIHFTNAIALILLLIYSLVMGIGTFT